MTIEMITSQICNNRNQHTSVNVNTRPLVHQVFIDAPCQDIAQALTHYSGGESSKVANEAIVLINLSNCLCDACVMLSLVLVVKLKENSRPNDIKRMSNDTA